VLYSEQTILCIVFLIKSLITIAGYWQLLAIYQPQKCYISITLRGKTTHKRAWFVVTSQNVMQWLIHGNIITQTNKLITWSHLCMFAGDNYTNHSLCLGSVCMRSEGLPFLIGHHLAVKEYYTSLHILERRQRMLHIVTRTWEETSTHRYTYLRGEGADNIVTLW